MEIIPEPEETFAMWRGSMLEPFGRKVFEEKMGAIFPPAVVLTEANDWQMASLDGLSPCGQYFVEIKFPNKGVRQLAKQGIVDEKYLIQMQHTIDVLEVPMGFYMTCEAKKIDDEWIVTDYDILEVKRDHGWLRQISQSEKEFWRRMKEYDPPEELLLVA
jgi:hypothetical protein